MNLEPIRALLELAEKATPGPWVNEGYYRGEPIVTAPSGSVAICCKDKTHRAVDTAAFLVAARNSVPALSQLLEAVTNLTAYEAELRSKPEVPFPGCAEWQRNPDLMTQHFVWLAYKNCADKLQRLLHPEDETMEEHVRRVSSDLMPTPEHKP